MHLSNAHVEDNKCVYKCSIYKKGKGKGKGKGKETEKKRDHKKKNTGKRAK